MSIMAGPEWQQTLLIAVVVPHTEDDVVPFQQPSQVLCRADPSSLGTVSPEVYEGPSTRG
jgi:hypothetical protein